MSKPGLEITESITVVAVGGDLPSDLNLSDDGAAILEIGFTGPAGADGADGATGLQGPQGPQGPAGADGADGSVITGADAFAAKEPVNTPAAANGNSSVAIGSGASAGSGLAGDNVAIGPGSSAPAVRSTAVGHDSSAASTEATAIGNAASAGSSNATAIGSNASASGLASVAIGNDTTTSIDGGVAIGTEAASTGTLTIAIGGFIGGGAQATANRSTAIGTRAVAAHDYSIALGPFSEPDSKSQMNINMSSVGTRYETRTHQAAATTNATPTTALGETSGLYNVVANSTHLFEVWVVAQQSGGAAGSVGDSKGWKLGGMIHRDGSNNTALIGSVTKTVIAEDAAASAWDVAAAADDTNESLDINVTGEVSKNITWQVVIKSVVVEI